MIRPKINVLFLVTLTTLIFLGLQAFGILTSILGFFKDFYAFSIQKAFIKKKICLPTNPKNIGYITGNKEFFFLA